MPRVRARAARDDGPHVLDEHEAERAIAFPVLSIRPSPVLVFGPVRPLDARPRRARRWACACLMQSLTREDMSAVRPLFTCRL